MNDRDRLIARDSTRKPSDVPEGEQILGEMPADPAARRAEPEPVDRDAVEDDERLGVAGSAFRTDDDDVEAGRLDRKAFRPDAGVCRNRHVLDEKENRSVVGVVGSHARGLRSAAGRDVCRTSTDYR